MGPPLKLRPSCLVDMRRGEDGPAVKVNGRGPWSRADTAHSPGGLLQEIRIGLDHVGCGTGQLELDALEPMCRLI